MDLRIVKKGEYVVVSARKNNDKTTEKTKSLAKLIAPSKLETDIEFFDTKKGEFKTHVDDRKKIPIPTAEEDNKLIAGCLAKLKELADSKEWNSCDEFFEAYLTGQSVPTFREYVEELIELWKQCKANKYYTEKSSNHQHYKRLLNLLQGKYSRKKVSWAKPIVAIGDKPITEIGSKDANKFVSILKINNARVRNYFNPFRASVYHYRRNVMKENRDSFKLQLTEDNEIAKRQSTARKEIPAILTKEEFYQLQSLDAQKVPIGKRKVDRQLYLDFFILLYGFGTRPIDLMRMRIEDIVLDEKGNLCWRYIAKKMVNTKLLTEDKGCYYTPIHPDFLLIVNKYKGERTAGYVFPFLEESWDWDEIEKYRNKEEGKMNRFLKDVGDFLEWSVRGDKLVLYTLRRSRINHMRVQGYSTVTIAYWTHSSEKEITKTYTNKRFVASQAIMSY